MDQEQLVESRIRAGEVLLRRLDTEGIWPSAALWAYFSDASRWRLMIASSAFDTDLKEDPRRAYRRLVDVMRLESDSTALVDIADVELTKTDDAYLKALGMLIRTGYAVGGIRMKGNYINGVFIEDAYVYRLASPEQRPPGPQPKGRRKAAGHR